MMKTGSRLKNFVVTGGRITAMLLLAVVGIAKGQQPRISDEQASGIRTVISYCNLPLAKEWKLGNLSFSAAYTFTLNAGGSIFSVRKIRDDFVGSEAVKACLSNWTLKGFRGGSIFRVVFLWNHKKGWIKQEIAGAGFTQIMTREGVGQEQLVVRE